MFLRTVAKLYGIIQSENVDQNAMVWRLFYLFATQSRLLTTLKKKALENTVRKGENAGNQHFLLFAQCFQLSQRE